ncbi:polysaccharide deacetylase family protein [Peribacillus frigoritolerans]|uniref:polysaccharide deacetylase family protein n=1 Tax=Peribacillus frigoritolerans TaxID=450367 RepID=UPI0039A27B2A
MSFQITLGIIRNFSILYTSQVIQQLKSTNEIIEKVTGVKATLIRPPYGDFTPADAIVFEKLGFKNILWSVDTLDWSGTSAEEIMMILNRHKSPGGIVSCSTISKIRN